MIYGLSKMRPVGHHHIYKYAHATNSSDLKRIAPSETKAYINYEITEDGRHYFPLTNLRRPDNYCFASAKLKYFEDKLPLVETSNHLFSGSALEKIEIENTGFKQYSMATAIPGIQMKPATPVDYKLKFFNVGTLHATVQQSTIRPGSNIQIYAPKAHTMVSIFEAYGVTTFQSSPSTTMNIEIDCRNVKDASYFAYYSTQVDELTFPIDEDGNHTFGSGKPEVARIYTTFPKLEQGKNMFDRARLTKNYTLAILNDLPDWSNDTVSHLISLGIHRDHKYDKELNLALKLIDNNCETPIIIPEEQITSNKGWTLSLYFESAAATGNEIICDDFLNKLELDSIQLPNGYKRCEYLESTGTQYINTEYLMTDSTGIWNIAKLITDTDPVTVGCAQNSINIYPPRWSYWNNNSYYAWGSANNMSIKGNKSSFESSLNYLNDKKAILVTEPSTSYSYDLGSLTTFPTVPLYIFGRNNNGTLSNIWKGRIYRVKISEGSEVVRDYIPCLDGDGVPCMRDIIQGVDYRNNGSGNFLYKLVEQ